MNLLIPLVLPILVLQALAGRRPLLMIGPVSALLIALAASSQVAAAITDGFDHVFVRAAFIFGLVALGVVFRSSTPSRAAFGLAVTGAALNLVPVLIFGSMPVPGHAAVAATSGSAMTESAITAPKHLVGFDVGGPIALLSDVIAIPVLHAAVSVGDVLVIAGFVVLAVSGARSGTPFPMRFSPRHDFAVDLRA